MVQKKVWNMLYPQWDFKSMVEHDHENIKNYKGLKKFPSQYANKRGHFKCDCGNSDERYCPHIKF